jgi:hypothetical protein
MKLKSTIYVIGVMTIVSSCGIPQADYDKVIAENKDLKTNIEKVTSELDECQNGAEKTIAKVLKAYSEKDYVTAKENISKLSEKHPESPKNAEFKGLLESIKKEEIALNKIKEAEEKERIKLANINNTGIWKVSYYVDEFGEPTKEGYITNKLLIEGKFSNTATQNSDLNVRFLISNSSDISIKLFEYARANPVKTSSSESYRVLMQDKDGERYKLWGANYSDRISFDKSESLKIHKALMKGGKIKFKMYESRNSSTEYDFEIDNSEWYNNAYTKLTEK